jgi:copper chaperone CopZ
MADAAAAAAPAEHTYEFNVTMSCGGCSGAVERVLKKLEGMSTTSIAPMYRLIPITLGMRDTGVPEASSFS